MFLGELGVSSVSLAVAPSDRRDATQFDQSSRATDANATTTSRAPRHKVKVEPAGASGQVASEEVLYPRLAPRPEAQPSSEHSDEPRGCANEIENHHRVSDTL